MNGTKEELENKISQSEFSDVVKLSDKEAALYDILCNIIH